MNMNSYIKMNGGFSKSVQGLKNIPAGAKKIGVVDVSNKIEMHVYQDKRGKYYDYCAFKGA